MGSISGRLVLLKGAISAKVGGESREDVGDVEGLSRPDSGSGLALRHPNLCNAALTVAGTCADTRGSSLSAWL